MKLSRQPSNIMCVKWVKKEAYLHRYIEEARQKKFVVDCHRYETTLIEFRRSLPHHNAQSNAPREKENFNCAREKIEDDDDFKWVSSKRGRREVENWKSIK